MRTWVGPHPLNPIYMETAPYETLQALKALDTCTVSNAIEQFGVRLRNEGFMNASVRCMFPHHGARVGYAVTGHIRTSSTPVKGLCYYHRLDWWSYVLTIPAPDLWCSRMPIMSLVWEHCLATYMRNLRCYEVLRFSY